MFNEYSIWRKKWSSWKLPTKISVVFGAFGLLIGLIGLGLSFTDIPENFKIKVFGDNRKNTNITSDFKNLSDQINDLYADSANIKGCTHFLVIRLNSIPEKRNKYIFDNGNNLISSRISLFLDEYNNLCYSITDSNSKEYILSIERKNLDSIIHVPVSIACEVLTNKYIWKQSIYINNIEYAKNIFNFPLQFDFKSIDGKNCGNLDSCINMKWGYDLNKEYPASFDAFLFSKTIKPFTSIERRKLHNISRAFLNSNFDTLHFYSYTGDGRRIWR